LGSPRTVPENQVSSQRTGAGSFGPIVTSQRDDSAGSPRRNERRVSSVGQRHRK
jgi:hypothetical protein